MAAIGREANPSRPKTRLKRIKAPETRILRAGSRLLRVLLRLHHVVLFL